MRPLICTLFLLAISFNCKAQPTDDHPFRYHIDFGFGLPGKSFKTGKNPNFIIGQARAGYGFSLKASRAVAGNLYVAFTPGLMYYSMNTDAIKKHALTLYDNNKYYTNINTSTSGIYLIYLGGQVSYVFNTKLFSFEPFIGTGILFPIIEGRDITASRKRQNSNYTDSLNISKSNTPAPMYATFGLRLNKKMAKRLNLSLSIAYNTSAKARYQFTPTLIDYFGNKQELNTIAQNVSFNAFQLETGIQFRFFRTIRRN